MSQRKLKRLAGAKNLGYRNVMGYSNLSHLSHYSQYSETEILLVLCQFLDSGSAVFRDSCLF